jgi:predicted kinase
MKKAIVTIGISASGKSVWAEEFVAEQKGAWNIICRDHAREDILSHRLGRALAPGDLWKHWKFKDENLVNEVCQGKVALAAARGENIIIADTNLNPARRDEMVRRLEAMEFTVEYKRFDITFEEAMKRDRFRANSVGPEVLWTQYKLWFQQYGMFKKYVPDNRLPSAVCFDIDGTLAIMNGKRGPFEWDKVTMDDHRTEIVEMAHAFRERGYKIIVLSGRDGVCREQTLSWLDSKDVLHDELFMRAEGDSRKDWIVKGEIFFRDVATKYNVMMVVDDRPQVVRLWSLIGLPCANVGEPMVEF